jgi:hypothetical protein
MMMDDSDDECIAPQKNETVNAKPTTSTTAKPALPDAKGPKKTSAVARKNKFPDACPQVSMEELKATKSIDQLTTQDSVKSAWSNAMASNYDPPLIGNQAQWMSKPRFAELASGQNNDFKLPRLNSPFQFSEFTDTDLKLYICPYASMFIRSTGAPPVLYGFQVNDAKQTVKMLILMEGDNKFVRNMYYPIHSSLVNALACQLTMCLPNSICKINPAITQLLHLCSVHFNNIDMLMLSKGSEDSWCKYDDERSDDTPSNSYTSAIDLLEKYGYLNPETKQPTDKEPTVELVMLQRLESIMRAYTYDGFASLTKRDDAQDVDTLINEFRTNSSIPFNGSTPFSTAPNTVVPTLESALTQIAQATKLLSSWDVTDRRSETRRMTIQDAFSPFFNKVCYNNGTSTKSQKSADEKNDSTPKKKKRRINVDDDSDENDEDSDDSYVEGDEDSDEDEEDSDEDEDSGEDDEDSAEDSDDGDDDEDENDDDKETRKVINRKYKKAGCKNKHVSEETLVRSEQKQAELQQKEIDNKFKEKEEFEAAARRAYMQSHFGAKDGIGGFEEVPDHDSEPESDSDDDIDRKLERRLKSKKRKKRGSSEAGSSAAIPHTFFEMQQRMMQTQIEFMEKINKLIDNKL